MFSPTPTLWDNRICYLVEAAFCSEMMRLFVLPSVCFPTTETKALARQKLRACILPSPLHSLRFHPTSGCMLMTARPPRSWLELDRTRVSLLLSVKTRHTFCWVEKCLLSDQDQDHTQVLVRPLHAMGRSSMHLPISSFLRYRCDPLLDVFGQEISNKFTISWE